MQHGGKRTSANSLNNQGLFMDSWATTLVFLGKEPESSMQKILRKGIKFSLWEWLYFFQTIFCYFVCFPNGCIEWGGSFHYLSDCRIRCTWASNSRGRWRGWSYICCDQGIQKYLGPWISLSLAYLEILYKLKFIGIKYFFLFGISDNYLT